MGLLRMAARTAVVAGTATAVSGRVARRQANRYEQKDEAQQAEQQQAAPQQYEQAPPPQAAPAAPQDDTISKIEQLAKLHEQGVLSDAEFTSAKAKVLGI